MKKLVAEQIVSYLERREVEYVFGLTGHTVIAMMDALRQAKTLKYVSVRHEQVAAHMADGYARVKHRAGVLLTHLGPGLTNATTGVANASLDSIPMVVIAGDVPLYYHGKHPHQEVNMHYDGSQHEIYRPFCKRVWDIDRPEAIPEVLDKAFRLAESGKPGPVLINVPMDMFSREIDTACFERTLMDSCETVRPSLCSDTAERIVKRLLEAKAPVVHAGGGVLLAQATDELTAFLAHLEIPVSRTLMGQSCLSDAHPLMMGMTGFWGTKFINDKTANADVILALGTRFAEADSSSWYKGITFDQGKTKFLQIDIEPQEIGRNYPVEIGAVADLKLALKELLKAAKKLCPAGVKRPEVIKEIADYKAGFKARNAAHADDRFPMTPQRILQDFREVFPEDGIITTDVGWNKNGVSQQFSVSVPGTIHHTSGLATMGFGSAAVMGAKLAAPDKKVVTLVGDGGFGTNPSVIATAVEQGIAVVWIVMNNCAFGTINGLERAHYPTGFGTTFHKPDGSVYSPEWAEIARGYGIKAKKITSTAEFKDVLKEALASDEPYLIDVPMENIPTPTEGIWNINDIYSPKAYVEDGRLTFGADVDAVIYDKHK